MPRRGAGSQGSGPGAQAESIPRPQAACRSRGITWGQSCQSGGKWGVSAPFRMCLPRRDPSEAPSWVFAQGRESLGVATGWFDVLALLGAANGRYSWAPQPAPDVSRCPNPWHGAIPRVQVRPHSPSHPQLVTGLSISKGSGRSVQIILHHLHGILVPPKLFYHACTFASVPMCSCNMLTLLEHPQRPAHLPGISRSPL